MTTFIGLLLPSGKFDTNELVLELTMIVSRSNAWAYTFLGLVQRFVAC